MDTLSAPPLASPSRPSEAPLDLTPFLAPASIAIVGASDDAKTIRGRLLEYLIQRDYRGEIYLVSPNRPEIRGRQTYSSLAAIPGKVDLVLIAVRADATPSVLRECAAIGARFAICFSSGFAESGSEGADTQRELGEVARASGLRLCGPNTAGFFNFKANVPATFARNVDAKRAPIATWREGPGTVAIVAQSGGLGFAMTDRCASAHGAGVSFIVSTGNEVDLEALDFVRHAIGQADIRAILLLVESIHSGDKLPEIAALALAAEKPIIVAKFGRTDAGSRAVGSHAARLTGSDEAYDAVFRRHGMIRIDDEDAMADLAAAFSFAPLPKGRRVGILTTSGGAGVWMADAMESAGLEVPVLDEVTQQALSAFVPSYGAIHNPVDMTAQVSVNPLGGSKESPLVSAVSAMLGSEALDAVVLIANMSDGTLLERERPGLARLAANLQKPLFLYSHAPPSPRSLELIQQLGLICFASTSRAAATLAHMADYVEARARGPVALEEIAAAIPAADVVSMSCGLCEYEAKALLKRYGLPVGEEALARSQDDAVAIAAGYGSAVALKIQSRQIPHKTEVGGVTLGLKTADEVRDAYVTLLERAKRLAPHATVDGVLVQKMQPVGRELAIGIVQDADFGPMMMVGMGGIHIEVLKDIIVEPLPVRRDGALAMLRRLRAWPLLEGVRGQAGADVEAVAHAMEALSRLVEASPGGAREIDLNPVFVYDAGQGAKIVDALIIGAAEHPSHD